MAYPATPDGNAGVKKSSINGVPAQDRTLDSYCSGRRRVVGKSRKLVQRPCPEWDKGLEAGRHSQGQGKEYGDGLGVGTT